MSPHPAPLPYWRLSSFYFWYYAALGAFTPYFAPWLDHIGQDAARISVLMALWFASRIIAPPLWSFATGRARHPVRWLRAGAVLALLSFAGFLLMRSFGGLFAVMLLFGFFCNAIVPQFEALALDTLGERRAEYSRVRLWGSIGFIVVTLAYGALLENTGLGWLPWLMLPLLLGTVASTFANGAPAVAAHAPGSADVTAWDALRAPGAIAFLGVSLLMQVGFGPYYVFFSLHMADQGYGSGVIGALWSLGVLAEIVMFVFAPRLLRRHGAVRLVSVCLALTVVRWMVTALLPHLVWVMAPLQLLHALSYGVFHAACMQLVSRYFPGRLGAQGQALLFAIGMGVGGVLGAMLAGAAWEYGGGRASFMTGAIAVAAGWALAWRLRAGSRHLGP